jgi:3',5'-cyclic AMP phosphodiesterase CpdA
MRSCAGVLFACLTLAGCGGNSLSGPTSQPSPTQPPVVNNPPPGPPGAPQVFVGAGDIAACDGNADKTALLLDTIGGLVFTLGDNAYFNGAPREFRDCYEPTWGRHRIRTKPVPGNHDYGTPGATGYFDYFGEAAGPYGLGYYSFDIGSWHAIALNSNIPASAGSAQAAWLASDLATHATACTIAYWHHPLFTSGPDGPSPFMRDTWRQLYSAGVEIVMNGHEHLYERFAPQNPDGAADPARGIRQFIAGTGGAIPYRAVSVQPNSEVRLEGFGVLKLTLASAGYEWEFVPVSGARDAGSGTCH